MKKYFLYDGATQYGPFDIAELETKIITPQTMVWYESLPEWKPAGEIEELKGLLNSKVPASQILTPPIIKAKEEDWSKKMFYYADDRGQQGPFTLEQLKNRPINPKTQVWYDPLPEWTTADKVAGLKDIITHPEKTSAPVASHKEETKRSYYYLDAAGQKQGPLTLEQLTGKPINAATLIWYDPLPEWIKAGNEESLKTIVASAQPAHTTPSPQNKSYYYLDAGGQKQGPFTLDQMKGKPVNASTLIWYDPLTEWIKAGNEESLRSVVTAAQPAQTTPSPQKTSYYYLDAAGQKQGPFTLEQMNGKPINASTLIWYDPLTEWKKAGNEESLRNVIAGAQPVHTNPAGPKRSYYYMDSAGQQQGPFTVEQLNGKPITAATLIWYDSLPQWIKAGSEDSLRNIIGNGAPGVDWSKKLFYYTDATGQQGPYTLDQLRGKSITASTPVWYDPLPQWTTAGQVEGLRGILH